MGSNNWEAVKLSFSISVILLWKEASTPISHGDAFFKLISRTLSAVKLNLRLILITQHLHSACVVIFGTKTSYFVVILTTKKHICCDFCGKGVIFHFCVKLVLGVILTFFFFTFYEYCNEICKD